jgi:hypothetical protein
MLIAFPYAPAFAPARSREKIMTESLTRHDGSQEEGKASHDSLADTLAHAARAATTSYAGDKADELPIGGYAALLALFVGSFTALTLAARRAGALPSRIPLRDIALLGVATHKLTRIVTRERIAIPLRVPFARYRGTDGAGMIREQPRGPGIRYAVGSMLTCQFCVGPWVASALTGSLIFAPRVTRVATSVFAMVAISDFLHQAYAAARSWSDGHN